MTYRFKKMVGDSEQEVCTAFANRLKRLFEASPENPQRNRVNEACRVLDFVLSGLEREILPALPQEDPRDGER